MGKVARKYGAAELRRAGRAPAAKRTIIHLCRAGQEELAMRVTVRDFSAGGIGFICARKMESGERFFVDPMGNSPGGTRQLYAVSHCRAAGKVSFIVGGQLVQEMPAGGVRIQDVGATKT